MSILHPKVVALLVGGFALVILLMLATGKRGLDALGELERGSSGLLSEERASARTLTSAQELEIAFDQIYYSVPGARRPLPSGALHERLNELERQIARTSKDGVTAADKERWHAFELAARAFIDSIRAALADPANASLGVTVTDAHERVAASVGQLVRDTDRRTERLATLDHEAFSRALEQHIRLLAVAVLLGLVVAGGTVFLVQRLFARMEWQRQELTRLSSDMLDTQEATLRQVSHDLHDQFGQTLTAIEANLAALDTVSADRRVKERVEDCVGLVQDLMFQARGMSQLLRPSILDDFGLSASLEWLAERFMQRTGIEVTYDSSFSGRLGDDMETHLFRIAQEAFTNAARHAGATRIDVALQVDARQLALTVADNGRGVQNAIGERRGLGLLGMRARTEQIRGELRVEPRQDGGTRVTVRAPVPQGLSHESQDTVATG